MEPQLDHPGDGCVSWAILIGYYKGQWGALRPGLHTSQLKASTVCLVDLIHPVQISDRISFIDCLLIPLWLLSFGNRIFVDHQLSRIYLPLIFV